MCLDIKSDIKPESVLTREHVYKVVLKYVGNKGRKNPRSKLMRTPYTNVFNCANETRYGLNILRMSNRNIEVDKKKPAALSTTFEKNRIKYGLHVFLNLEDAHALVRSLNAPEDDNSWNVIYNDNYEDWVFAILKCKVNPKDHVADGMFDISVGNDGSYKYCGHKESGGLVASAVYHKILPVEEVFSVVRTIE